MDDFLDEVRREVARARKLHPNEHGGTFAALVEEVGEVGKALLDEPWDAVRVELVQVACMAMRLAEEGDKTMAALRDARIHDGGTRYTSKKFMMPKGQP